MYPHLSRLIVNDLEYPESITIVSEERLEELAEEEGLEVDFLDDEYGIDFSEEELSGLIGFDDDEDGNGGLKH